MKESNDLLGLLKIAYKWRRFIIGITAVAAIASVIISLTLMDDYFKSSVTFYPSNPTMTSRAVMFSESAGENQIDYFGGNSDIDRILTLSQTSGTIDYIINKYELYDHYGLDTTKEMGRYKTRKRFEKNYNTRKTVLGAVEISIWDKDRELAAEIANHIAENVDDQNKAMINKERLSIIAKLAERMSAKESQVSLLTDSIEQARRSGMSVLQLQAIQTELDYAVEDLNSTRRLHEQYSTAANIDNSTINITERAFPALRKDKPKRSLVCAGYTLSAFFAALIFAVVVEVFRKIRPEFEAA